MLAIALPACGHSAASPYSTPTPRATETLERAMVLSTSVTLIESASFLSSAHGMVVGRVVFEGEPPPVIRRPVRVDAALCGDEAREDRSLVIDPATRAIRYAVVTLVPKGPVPGPAPAIARKPAIDQARCDFFPYVTLVRPGATVDVVNSDAGLHDLHRLEPGGPGSHDPSPPGSHVPLTFHRAGRTRLVCDLHYWSSAWVIATDAPFAAVTDAKGAFAFRDVPIGAWTLEVWHERLGSKQVELKVGANETARTQVALPLPRPAASATPH